MFKKLKNIYSGDKPGYKVKQKQIIDTHRFRDLFRKTGVRDQLFLILETIDL